ncbi:hypothetical protein Plhal304r1_c002g0007601 [Plasmopara halstedii]
MPQIFLFRTRPDLFTMLLVITRTHAWLEAISVFYDAKLRTATPSSHHQQNMAKRILSSIPSRLSFSRVA